MKSICAVLLVLTIGLSGCVGSRVRTVQQPGGEIIPISAVSDILNADTSDAVKLELALATIEREAERGVNLMAVTMQLIAFLTAFIAGNQLAN